MEAITNNSPSSFYYCIYILKKFIFITQTHFFFIIQIANYFFRVKLSKELTAIDQNF